MADANANIRIDVDTSAALSQIKELQRQISIFHSRMAQSGKAAAAQSAKMQANLINSINATKGFSASMTNIKTSTESFTNSLEKNKFSMGEYFRYAGASTKTFGKLFKSEFNTIEKVARERTKDLQTQYVKLGRDASGAMKAIKIRPTTLDMKDLGTQTAIAAQKQQLFNQLIKQGSTNLLNWGKNTQWAGRQLMVGFTIPLTIMGATAAREFMKLEEQAIRFKRVYGDMFTTDKETDQALENVRELAKEFTKFGVAIEDTIDLAASVAQMGAMGADLTNQVTQATRLAVLGGIEQQEALDTTISLTNAFGLATEQLAGKIAFLNAAENQTILSIEDFNEAIPKAGSVVKQLGGDVEDLAYFLTAMREGGINASQSANALKSSLARLINPTEVASEKLGAMGIDIIGIVNDNAGNLKGTIQALAVELDKLNPLDKSRAIEQLFGKFQFARMSTLFENIVKEGSQANKILELTTNSTEELAIIAERELARVSESPMYKFRKSIEEFQAAMAPIGQAFMELATPLVEFGTRVLDQFNNMSDGAKRFLTGAVAIGGVIAPVLIMTIGLIANALANTIKFGNIIRNAFTGAAQSSDILTDQYQYMNSEQIEAAAVAASLDQVHSKLRQTFTSEAAAIEKLVVAYQNAITKQNQMAASGAAFGMGTPGGKGKAPKKYAKGVVSVPGPKGAGDIVPAMLSPGEAVIPAEMVKKYGSIIDGMITDSLPGYEQGGYVYRPGERLVETHLQEASPLSPGKNYNAGLVGQFMQARPGVAGAAPEVQQNISVLGQLVADLPAKLNEHLKRAGVEIDQFEAAWDGTGDKLTRTVSKGMDQLGQSFDPNDPVMKQEIAELEAEIKQNTRKLAKKTGGVVTDATLSAATQQANEKLAAKGNRAAQASQLRAGTLREYRTSYTKEDLVNQVRGGKLSIKETATGGGKVVDPASGLTVGRLATRGGRSPQQQMKEFKAGTLKLEQMGLRQESKFVAMGKEAARKYVEAFKKRMKKGGKDPYMETRDRKSPHRQAAKDGQDDAKAYGNASRKEMRRQERKSGGRMAGIGTKLKGAAPKVAGAGMAVSSGLMMASMMGGPMGEMAGNLMGPMMALSMALPLLTSGIGAAVLAIGAMVAGIMWVNSSFNKTQEEAMKLAESLGGGSKAMEAFSAAAGKVSAGEIMDKRRENQFGVFQIQPGKNTFGNTFLGSEGGEEMLANVRSSLASNGSDATQELVRNQLATAVSSGALDTAQARSIVAALSTELQDYSFGIAVNAELTQLLGPNGENLARDPLGIRIKILEDSQKNMSNAFNSAMDASVRTGGDIFKEVGLGLGGAVAGGLAVGLGTAALGAKIGGTIGTAVGGPVGLAIGAGIGAIAGGITGAIVGGKDRKDRIAKASGASVAMQKVALQQQQEMMDSLELEYEQRIQSAAAAGDVAEAERLATERVQARVQLLEKNQELTSQIVDNFATADRDLQNALMSGADKAMEATYADTALADVVPLTSDVIESNVADKELQYLLKMQVASEEIGPIQMMNFLETFDKGSLEQDAMINMITKMGGAFANQAMSLIDLFEDEAMQKDILLNIASNKDPEEANALLAFYQQLSQSDVVLDREAKFKFILENPEAAERLQDQLANINNFEGEITMDVIANIVNADAVDALNADLDYFQGLNNDMKKIYLQTLVTTIQTVSPNDPALQNWLNGDGAYAKNFPPGTKLAEYARYNAGIVTKIAADLTGQEGEPQTTGSGGGGPKGSVLDDLTKKIRDLRLETFKAQVGWDASAKALENLFKGGDKTLDVFNGLANRMRSLGASSGMIDMILGMDPKEFEKRKKELFNLDPQGNIVGLTTRFKSLGAAVNAIALGEYVNSQESFIENTKNQFTAMSRLTGEGLSFVQAYEMVQDQALATAIAMAASNKEVEELIQLAERLEKFKDKKTEIDEEARAAQAIQRTNKEFRERYLALGKIAREGQGLDDSQINAILSDPNLARLYLNPQIDPRTLEERLKQANAKANLELRLKVATEEGKEALFDEVMGEIQDQFSRKEQEIDVNFRLATEDDSDIIREAQNKIAAIQFEIDDYQAELEGIADQEDVINDKYDKRFEALDKVGQANERIARAQQAQLDVADALSRGDIAAAARAQAQLRAQEAEASAEERRAQLERQKEAELANIRSESGKSRQQIEDAVKQRQDQIFKIEEDELEPAQERIRIAEYEKEVQLDTLEIAGRTRDEWDKIANAVDLATVNAEDFELAIKRALALFEYFVNGKPLDLSLFGDKELQELISSGQVTEEDLQDSAEQAAVAEVQEAIKQAEATGDTETVKRMTDNQTKIQEAARDTVMKMVSQGAGSLTEFEKILIGAPGASMTPGEFTRNALGSMMSSGGMNSLSPQERLMLGLEGGSRTAAPKTTTPRYPSSSSSAPVNAPNPVGSTNGGQTAKLTDSQVIARVNVVEKARSNVQATAKTSSGTTYRPNATKVVHVPGVGSLPSYIAAYLSGGGMVKGYSMGGAIKRYAAGGLSLGSDTVPAMLSPGEFVIRRSAAQSIGLDNLEKMNNTGTYNDGSVYNYNLAVNVSSMSDPDKIARTVMKEIKRVESQRVRGNRF